MRVNTRISATVSALLAAAFYAISTPVSKVLLNNVGPTVMAALLYLGAGFGVGIMYMLKIGSEAKTERLTRSDIPYTIGMILLDIAATMCWGLENNCTRKISSKSTFVVYDTMLKHHVHMHTHTIVHTHDGSTHTHTVQHEHGHDHFLSDEKHAHHHDDFMFSEEHRAMHKAVAED